MNRKQLTLMSLFGASVLSVVALAGTESSDPSFVIAAESPWIHYSAVDPTAETAGIKEFYVNCTSHEHRLTKPTSDVIDGEWTADKKAAIQSDPDDDRYIKSFSQLDAMISSYRGNGAFDYTHIKEAKNYYDANYSASAKTNYVSSSNAIFDAKAKYDSLYGVLYNAQTVGIGASSSSGVFTYSQEEDSLYGGVTKLEFLVDVTPGSTYASKDIYWKNPDGDLGPISSSNRTISFAIYASEACSFNLVAVYDSTWSQDLIFSKSLNIGWNEYTFDCTDQTYRYLTNAESIRYIQLQIGNQHSAGSIIKVSSFIGLSAVNEVEKRIEALPDIADVGPKDYDNIKSTLKAYNALSDHDKARVSNYSKLNTLYGKWNNQYVVLYDMSESYAGFSTYGGGSLSQSLIYDEEYGNSKAVTVVEGFQALFLSSHNKAYTDIELSEIVYYVKPSANLYMSWVGNYGRRVGDPLMMAGQWNRYSVSGTVTISGEEKNAVDAFMDNFNTGPYSVINMNGESNRWGAYCLNEVGFSFQMTSMIGVRKQTSTQALNQKIASLPSSGSVDFEHISSIYEIEEEYESLDSSEKVMIQGMDHYYEIKGEFNRKFSYIMDPKTSVTCWQEPNNISSHEIGVYEKYGPCYLFHVIKNTGTTLVFKPETLTTSANGAKIFTKNYGNMLDFCIGDYTNVVVEKTSGTSLGDGWYEYTLTKSEINAILGYQSTSSKNLFIMVPGNTAINKPLLAGTEFYLSGIFGFNDVSYDASSVASVQSQIDALPSAESITPYSNVAISAAQDAVYGLSPAGQRALTGAEKLTNLYSAYKDCYEMAYSLDVYRYGSVWYQCAIDITPGYDTEYGNITSFESVGGKYCNISLGSWIKADNYNSNSYSGQGRPISPLEHGKYQHVYFSVYSPMSERITLTVYAAQEKVSTSLGIQSFYIYPGWNNLSFNADSIEKLSGYFGGEYKDFQGLNLSFPNLSSSYVGWKLTGFVGEKNSAYEGDSRQHYASGTIHENVENIHASSTPLFESGTSTYKVVYSTGGLADDAVSFLKKTVNEQAGVVLSFTDHASFSEDGRYIYIGSASEMASAGIMAPDEETLGDSGYIIRTVGESVFIFAYGKDGYRMGILKFLEASIGYEWISHDLSINEVNGSTVSSNSTFYLPQFEVVERPDYDIKTFTNNTRWTDSSGIYGSGLDPYRFYLTDDGAGNRIGDMVDYLPYETYSDYYYSDSKGKSFCYSCKGNATMMENAIKIVGDKIIAGAIAHPEINYAGCFQVDSGTHCNCSACKALYGDDFDMYASVLINFMNKLDDYIKANYTERTIKLMFLAYSFNYTLKVPTNISCHKNVVPWVAPIRARWCYSFYDEHNSTAKGETDSSGNVYQYDNDYASIVEGWANYASEIAIWAYQTSYGSSLLLYNTFDTMMDQYRYFYNIGARFMSNEGNWTDNGSGFIALKDYIDSKALNNVNANFDEIYATFFKAYYGAGGEAMRNLFDEVINNFNYCLDRYGRHSEYNPDNSKVQDGSNYYFDGRLEINASYDYSIFWGDDGKNPNYIDVYNASQNLGASNIANINKWLGYVETALTQETRDVYQKHIKGDALMVYWLAYRHKGRTDLADTIANTSYEVGTYWYDQYGMLNDNHIWKTGTNTICYKVTGQTYQAYFGL